MPASAPNLPTSHTGVIDTIIPAAGPWSWVRKSASYLLRLAPLFWWALPAKNLAQVTPENDRLATQDWIPDTCLHNSFYVNHNPPLVTTPSLSQWCAKA
ncbi:hypothetical protein DSO57_1022493 [Entomophthora muscae]|uniref:Uncharacterized protein n=1 Tax=Entomophthora muscae TaxID=34485 RepID=A0ACC2UDA1_9FUNG|nr:hypothetical protein DSO57_1022493 [Entomophthora muscae]